MSLKSATKSHHQILIALALCFSLLPMRSTIAAPSKVPSEKEVVENFIADVGRDDSATKSKDSFNAAAQHMDFEEMARRAFGEAGWAKFSAAEQKEVVQLFRRLMQVRFYPRWHRVFKKGIFKITAQSKKGADSLVAGNLYLDDQERALIFRLAKTGDAFKLINMSIKDKDMLERTSVRLKRTLKQKGTTGLIAHLRKRIEEAPKTSGDKAEPEELVSGDK